MRPCRPGATRSYARAGTQLEKFATRFRRRKSPKKGTGLRVRRQRETDALGISVDDAQDRGGATDLLVVHILRVIVERSLILPCRIEEAKTSS